MLIHPPQSPYQVGGSLPPTAASYVERQADQVLFQALLDGEFCYVFDSRQMGKSSLRVRTMARLQQVGVQSLAIDLTSIGSQQVTVEQWYAAIAASLVKGFQLSIPLRQWWQAHHHLPVVARLAELIDTVLLTEVQRPIVVLIDEIDSILGLQFPTDDFFALIRTCLNRRAENPDYQRLTFALFGVTSPSELISDKKRTPFNVGKAITLERFTWREAETLSQGLREFTVNAEQVLRRILYWTGGQPFLTQKLCHLVLETSHTQAQGLVHITDQWVDELVTTRIIDNWEMQDKPEHLRTIRDRLWYNPHHLNQLLNLYQQVLKAEGQAYPAVVLDGSAAQLELLLVGLVDQHQGQLRTKNRICQKIFNLDWVEHQLNHLRPYSQALNTWIHSGYCDESRLLRGQALQETLLWAQNQSLSEVEYRFLAASQEIDRQETVAKIEAEKLKAVEARLSIERERGLEQQRSLSRQRYLLTGVSLTMLTAVGLGVFAEAQSRQASLNEARAIVRTAEALFASDQSFEALLEAIRGQQRIAALPSSGQDLQSQANTILERVILSIHQRNRLDGHQAAVMTASFSPDGQRLATAGVKGDIKIWSPEGRLLTTLAGHQGNVRGLQFSPDGRWLVSAGDDGLVQLWTTTGDWVRSLKTDIRGIWGLSFTPDSQTLIIGGPAPKVEIWSVQGERTGTINTGGQPAGIRALALSPQGDTIALGGNDNTVTLWTLAGRRLGTFAGHRAPVHSLVFSPDGQRLVSGSLDKTIKIWQLDGTLLKTLESHGAAVEGLAFSPSGREFVSASHDKTLVLWSRDGELLETFRGHRAIVWDVAFSPDGKTLASVGADNAVLLWQAHNAFSRKATDLPSAIALKTIYSHDGQTITTTATSNGIILFSTVALTYENIDAGQSAVTNLALHPQQDQFLSAGEDGSIKRWDMTGQELQRFSGHYSAVLAVAWHPEGQEIASGTASGQLFRWSAEGQIRQSWAGHPAPVWDVAYHPAGHQLASAGNDGTAKLWSRDGQLLQTLQHDSAVWRVAYSPDGDLIATSSGDNTAKLWHPQDGTLVTTLVGHHAAVWGITFSPDGQYVATSSVDETVRLWNRQGELLKTLKGHDSGVRNLAFQHNGQTLASVGDDGTLTIWNLPAILSLEPLEYACNWVASYLETNARVAESDRALCRPSP